MALTAIGSYMEARAMLVRLATAWIDPAGVVHGAGEQLDVDAVTLAELEEQGVVEIMTEPVEKETRNGPTGTELDVDAFDTTGGENEDDRNGPTDENDTGGGN